jgi:indolepyruvate ferredoxin oxidoreductase beta subunit
MPLPGDVDVVLASELMEAGRAVQRGLVTSDRTTLIASTHRVYAIAEKMAMGDGRVDTDNLLGHAMHAAKRFIRFDMARMAEDAGSVISAVLFGALAGAGILPFGRREFEATIERSGVGVKASLQAFSVSFSKTQKPDEPADAPPKIVQAPMVPSSSEPHLQALLQTVATEFPVSAREVLIEGVRRTIDYQDLAYARLYLDRLAKLHKDTPDGGPWLTETARHLALWMTYEDTIRVAELKTRDTRFERVNTEMRVRDDQLLAISEFMHPRVQEICETLPASLGRWLAESRWPRRVVERFTRKGRVVTTSSLSGFLMLYALSGLKRWRRSTLRFQLENAHIEKWLVRILQVLTLNPQLATEVAQCQRLVKGYGDTHERGLHNFLTVMAALDRAGNRLAPATLQEVREAALADERGDKLNDALMRLGLSALPASSPNESSANAV